MLNSLKTLLLVTCCICSPTWASDAVTKSVKTVEWTDLIPAEDLRLLESIPQIDHDSLSDEELSADSNSNTLRPQSSFENQQPQAFDDSAGNSNKERTWKDALVSTRVRPEFNNQRIRLGAYISPIEWNDKQVTTEFFVVPYFGACIHVPPPPPNQIIYVHYPKGLKLDDLYMPFWVEGTIKIEITEKDIGDSSYTMTNVVLSEYTE